MALEIERKFLVKKGTDIESLSTSHVDIGQAYLCADPDHTVRVRVYGEKGYLTVKTRSRGAVRHEWEYEIPVDDAKTMMTLPGTFSVVKTRYFVPVGIHVWEVDVFHKHLEGLVTAEIELTAENESFELPSFVDDEVTHDARYFNSNLSKSLTIPKL